MKLQIILTTAETSIVFTGISVLPTAWSRFVSGVEIDMNAVVKPKTVTIGAIIGISAAILPLP